MIFSQSALRIYLLFVFQAVTSFSAIISTITPAGISPSTPTATSLQATFYDTWLPDSNLLLHTTDSRLAAPLFLPALRGLIVRGRNEIVEQGRIHGGGEAPILNNIFVNYEGLILGYYPSRDPGLRQTYRTALHALEGVETAVTRLGFKEVDWFLYAMDDRRQYRRGNAAHGFVYHSGQGVDAAMLNVTALNN
ncbi:MAG: hypothetical protein Q9167_007459 [Letrouitia subvulpina]